MNTDKTRVLKSAKTHTNRVRALRIILPVCAFISFCLYFITTNVSFQLGPGNASVEKVEISGRDVRMENPTYTGFDERNGKYEVKADYALQNIKEPYVFNLHKIEAKTNNSRKEWVQMLAAKGIFDAKKEWLKLSDGINIKNHSGMSANLQVAHVDMKTRKIRSEKPVYVDMPNGTMRANTMEIDTSTQHLTFRNNVKVHLKTPTNREDAVQAQNQGFASMFRQGTQDPIEVVAQQLEVFNKERIAMFQGEVLAAQGNMSLQSDTLQIDYNAAPEGAETNSDGGGADPADQAQQIAQIKASNNVRITGANGSTATAESTIFDNQKQLITLYNNVRISQNKNLISGDKLVIDLQKQHSSFPKGKNIIKGQFYPPNDAAANTATAQQRTSTASQPGITEPTFSGFRNNSNDPIFIEAASLDIFELRKKAIFQGNVKVNRGGNLIKSEVMELDYVNDPASGNAQSAVNGQIRKITAKKDVFITTQDKQTVSGQRAVFDLAKDSAVIDGDVVLTQDGNVLKGDRLLIDLKTGEYRLKDNPNTATNPDSGTKTNGRVRLMFTPGTIKRQPQTPANPE